MTANQFKLYRLLLATAVVALNVLPVSGGRRRAADGRRARRARVVRLGDVAKIKSDDEQEAKRLAAIPLLPAPAPGRQRFIRMREIQDLLAAQGEDMSALNFSGELMVEIAPPRGTEPTTERASTAAPSGRAPRPSRQPA